MNEYWLTTFETEYNEFFEDYLTNKQKRFQTFLDSTDFWKDYVAAYQWAKENGYLIVRAKIIKGQKFTLCQIWKDRYCREEFDKKVNEDYFLQNFKFEYIRSGRAITKLEKDSIVEDIMNSNSILQYVHEDHRLSGMIIGDPLKNDSLIKV
jgi:hypothetical protein